MKVRSSSNASPAGSIKIIPFRQRSLTFIHANKMSASGRCIAYEQRRVLATTPSLPTTSLNTPTVSILTWSQVKWLSESAPLNYYLNSTQKTRSALSAQHPFVRSKMLGGDTWLASRSVVVA